MILVNLKPLFNGNLLKDGLGDYSSVGLTLAAGTLLLLLFLIFNYWSIKASGVFQTFSLILKFLPLLAVSVFGFLCFFLFVSSNDKSLWGKWWSEQLASTATDASSNKPFKFEFNRMVVVIPAILFAFDGFVGFGALAPDVKRAKKRMPLIFVLGMLSIIFIYLAVTLAQTFTSQGIS